MNRVWCAFESHYTNPLTGRHGRWRVIETYPAPGAKLVAIGASKTGAKLLGVVSTRQHKPGSIISPRAEVRRYFASQKQTNLRHNQL